jgi:Fur family transcriptional regulator, ferric uptake regulator
MTPPHDAPELRWQTGADHNRVQKEVFLDFLASKHLKLTRQRQAVVDQIFSDSGHFEAEELVERLKNRRSRVSRATVYRTLELLRECQLVEKLDFGSPRSFYEHVTPGEHHDHLICTRCNNVIEFHNERLEAQQREICNNFGFQESHHSLRIFGLCSKCAQAAG